MLLSDSSSLLRWKTLIQTSSSPKDATNDPFLMRKPKHTLVTISNKVVCSDFSVKICIAFFPRQPSSELYPSGTTGIYNARKTNSLSALTPYTERGIVQNRALPIPAHYRISIEKNIPLIGKESDRGIFHFFSMRRKISKL